jgi:SIR2-like domain
MWWHEDALNLEHVHSIREAMSDKARILVFLGAGLSFGAARLNAKHGFEAHSHDDELPLPSWPLLMKRMCKRLESRTSDSDMAFLRDFFDYEGPLDCAELYRKTVGEQNYAKFLFEQFDDGRYPFIQITPSHEEIVKLDLPLLFSTNYDQLLERAYRAADVPLSVSIDEDQFKGSLARRPARHLVKMHGGIENAATIILTRTDYAKSRSLRREMFGRLRSELTEAIFLFIGFSLADPNLNILHDDVRESLGMLAPVSYLVQGRRDPVKQRYLESLGINTVWLENWNYLPDFLRRINPQEVSVSVTPSL